MEKDKVAGAVKSAQSSFMVAFDSISDAHNALAQEVQLQSDARNQDKLLSSSRMQKIEASAIAMRVSVEQQFDVHNAYHRKHLEEAVVYFKKREEELRDFVKTYCNKGNADTEERLRVFTTAALTPMKKQIQASETSTRESMDAHQAEMKTSLQDVREHTSKEVSDLNLSMAPKIELMDQSVVRIADLESRSAEHLAEFRRLNEFCERFALAAHVSGLEARISGFDRVVASWEKKLTVSEAQLSSANRELKMEVHSNASAQLNNQESTKARFAEFEKRLENFRERVGVRLVGLQDDISDGRDWSQKRLEAHAESLRRVNAEVEEKVAAASAAEPVTVRNGRSREASPVRLARSREPSPLGDVEYPGVALAGYQDLTEIKQQLDNLFRWRDDVSQWQGNFNQVVDMVRSLATSVETRSENLLNVEGRIEEMAKEAQCMFELQKPSRDKCLSCGIAGAARAAGVAATPAAPPPSPPRFRSPSPPHDISPWMSGRSPSPRSAVEDYAAGVVGEKASLQAISDAAAVSGPGNCQTEWPADRGNGHEWPAASGSKVRSRPASATSARKVEGDSQSSGSAVSGVVGRAPPVGNAMAACRGPPSASKLRRPLSARARIGDTSRRALP